jgi:hypothetical protein
MLDDFKVILYEYRAALKKNNYKATINLSYMFKNKSYIGISFIILVLEYMRFLNNIRIQNNEVVREIVWTS